MGQKTATPQTDTYADLLAGATGLRCVKEFRFHPVRKWRFDYAFPERKLAIEIDGGVWRGGRHNHPVGYLNDMEKFNHAALMGWRVLKFTPQQKAQSLPMIKAALDDATAQQT